MKTFDQTTYTRNPMVHADMSADAYTAFLQAERRERTLTNIARRAGNLWADGYTVEETGSGDHFRFFTVNSPRGDHYGVRLSDTPHCEAFGDHCSCPCFEKLTTCKHLLAVRMKDTEDAEADAEWERMEETRNFFDSRADAYLDY